MYDSKVYFIYWSDVSWCILPSCPAQDWKKILVSLNESASQIRNWLSIDLSSVLWLVLTAVIHLFSKRGDVVVEGVGGADVAVIGHAGEVGGGWEGGGVSGGAGGELALFKN